MHQNSGQKLSGFYQADEIIQVKGSDDIWNVLCGVYRPFNIKI